VSLIVHGQATGPFAENTYLAYCPETSKAVIIDPGQDCLGFVQQLLGASDLTLEHILLTHAHLDHIFGLSDIKLSFDVPVHMHPDDQFLIDGYEEMAREFGFEVEPAPQPEESYVQGDVVQVGAVSLEVIHTPGHSPGGVCLAWNCASGPEGATDRGVFSGDTIMGFSVGRTDFPRSDAGALERSIRERVYALPDETVVFPGHMQPTTIADEKRQNMFVRV